MNTLTQKIKVRQTYRKPHNRVFTVVSAFALLSLSTVVNSNEILDLNALFNPDKSLLNAEARGRVTIYDGLKNQDIEQAMDEQFDRIGHMMFIGTRHVQADGEEIIDDDC